MPVFVAADGDAKSLIAVGACPDRRYYDL